MVVCAVRWFRQGLAAAACFAKDRTAPLAVPMKEPRASRVHLIKSVNVASDHPLKRKLMLTCVMRKLMLT